MDEWTPVLLLPNLDTRGALSQAVRRSGSRPPPGAKLHAWQATTSPVAIPTGICKEERTFVASFGTGFNKRKFGPHRPLGIMVMCLRIAEIGEHAVAGALHHQYVRI
jgi:hypothetical protein